MSRDFRQCNDEPLFVSFCLSFCSVEIVDQPGLDIFGQVYNQWKNKECVCPNCNRSIAASRFAPHLEKCLGMGRNSSRIASRRSAHFIFTYLCPPNQKFALQATSETSADPRIEIILLPLQYMLCYRKLN